MLTFHLMGSLRVTHDGQRVELGGFRHREVLALLLLARGQVVPTERLIADIWGEHPPRHAHATIRTIVFHLRRVLEPDRQARAPARVLVTAGPGYALHADTDDMDLYRVRELAAESEELLAAGRNAEALDRCREGVRMWPGFPHAEFAQRSWAQTLYTRHVELHLGMLEGCAEALIALGRAADAVADLESLVTDHPLREDAWRLLALAHYRAGRQCEALAVLRRVRTVLREELGVDPGPALRRLETDILRQSPDLAPAIPAQRPQTERARESLTGRGPELERMSRVAAVARAGRLRLILVEGPAGIGKSALAEQFRTGLRADGWITGTTRVPDAVDAPDGWPWLEILTQVREPGALPTGTRFEFCRALGERLGSAAARGRLALVLEDLHLADEDTLAPLLELAHRLADRPVLLIGTLRPGPHSEPLTRVLAGLAAHQPERIELGGLTAPDCGAVVAAATGARITAEMMDQVRRRTGGSPLLVLELARLLAVDGPRAALSRVPAGAREVLEFQVSRLSEPVRELVRKAAVLGEEFELELLAELAGADNDKIMCVDNDAFVDGVEEGLASGILVEGAAKGVLRFANTLLFESVRAGILAPRRAQWHRSAAAAYERLRPTDVGSLARHHLNSVTARTATETVRCLRAAADQAVTRFDHAESIRLRRSALEVLDRFGATAGELASLLGELISAHAHLSEVEEMYAMRDRAVAPLAELADPALIGKVIVSVEPGNLMVPRRSPVHRDRIRAVVQLLDRSLAQLPPGDSPDRAMLLAKLAIELYGDAGPRGRSAAAEAMGIAERIELPARTHAIVLQAAHTQAYPVPGRLADRIALAQQLLHLARENQLWVSERLALLWLLYAAEQQGDLPAAEGMLTELELQVRRVPHPATAARVQWHRAVLLDMANAPEAGVLAAYGSAARAMEDAGVQRAVDILRLVRWCRAYRAGTVAELLPELEQRRPVTTGQFALTLAIAGEHDRAREALRQVTWPTAHGLYELHVAFLGLAAARTGLRGLAASAYRALLPADGELLGPGGAVFLPVRSVLDELRCYVGQPVASKTATGSM
ncbi:hypothetical protein D5S17_24455 [Pseudonocardiaceae bacterium YIM PH 21723]|nr:hypothetical protein D5S17_24455 [Pseudonocardiaceae bacterium YIM PH 21723]